LYTAAVSRMFTVTGAVGCTLHSRRHRRLGRQLLISGRSSAPPRVAPQARRRVLGSSRTRPGAACFMYWPTRRVRNGLLYD
jgi:hypothetical protein